MGRHTCPGCKKPSQIKRSALQFFATAIITWAAAALLMIFLKWWLGGRWYVLGILPMVLIALPCDKMLDEKFRGLEPMKSKELNATGDG